MTRVHQKAKKREKGTVYFFAPTVYFFLPARKNTTKEQRGQFASSASGRVPLKGDSLLLLCE